MKTATPTIAVLLVFGCSSVWANTVFTDATFNLADYNVSTSVTGNGSVAYSQSTTAGNPAPSLDVVTTVSSGNVLQLGYFLNKSFVYNPASQGAIGTVVFSQDINFSVTGLLVFVAAEGASSIISQDGNLYVDRFTPPTTLPGQWVTAGGTIKDSDYGLITDVKTLAIDATKHPNFDGGPIQFGFISAWDSPNLNPNVSTELFDNLSITVNPSTPAIPEPATYGLTIIALLLCGGLKLKRPPQTA